MSHNLNEPILLLGAGYMAVEYAKVLNALGTPFICVGRGTQNTATFFEKTGHNAIPGGIDAFLKQNAMPKRAVVTVNADASADAVLRLIETGVKHILAEKPVGLDVNEVRRVADAACAADVEVLAAYNRRFYASTLAAEAIIREEGGADSASFEFTEWLHTFMDDGHSPREKAAWLQANSSHVLDLAFYLCGKPKKITCYTKGTPNWYGNARAFAGAGITENGAIFSYASNWTGPGRWGLEVIAGSRRLIFRPMEQLHVQEMKSVEIKKLDIDDSLDTQFKPGVYLQTQAFLEGTERHKMLDIVGQLENSRIYAKIAGSTGI